MTLQIVPYAQQTVYLPLPDNNMPTDLKINSLSFYDLSLNAFISNYELSYSSEKIYVNAFVVYPQTVMSYTNQKNVVIYKNEGTFDDKMLGFINTALVVYEDDKISANQVLSRPISGVQYVAFYNDDILIFSSSPQGIYFYSYKQNKFYNVYIPTAINLQYLSIGSILFLGGYIYFTICTISYSSPKSGELDVTATYYLMYTKFNYSDLTLTVITDCSIAMTYNSSTQTQYTAGVASSIVGNGSYIAVIMLFCTYYYVSIVGIPIPFPITYVKILVYNVNTGSYNTYHGSLPATLIPVYSYYQTIINQQGMSIIFNFRYYQQSVSIYSYYVFIIFYIFGDAPIVFSFNINTSNIELASLPTGSFPPVLTSVFMLRSNILYIFSKHSSPVQYGNTYYLPVNVYMYEITTSEMLSIEYSTLSLYKDTLTISGTVKYVQTGEPTPNATVSVYLYESVQGHSYAISSLIIQTTTDNNGNFTITYKFKNAPNDANIIVTASIDPVIMEVVYPVITKPTQSKVSYP